MRTIRKRYRKAREEVDKRTTALYNAQNKIEREMKLLELEKAQTEYWENRALRTKALREKALKLGHTKLVKALEKEYMFATKAFDEFFESTAYRKRNLTRMLREKA